MKIAQVCFPEERSLEIGSKKYSYFTDIDNLEWQEAVVVETRYGLKVAIFMHYIESDNPAAERASAWIVQTIDTQGLELKKARAAQVKDLKDKLNARKAKLEERAVYEILAQSDKEMAVLLAQYDQLIKGGI